MTECLDLSLLAHEEKDALIRALWAQVQALTARVAELEAKLDVPQDAGQLEPAAVPGQGDEPARKGQAPRSTPGQLGPHGRWTVVGRPPAEIVSAKPVRCAHCQAALAEADHVLHGRYAKIDLPQVAPVVTRVERYAGRCRCCGARRGRRCWKA
jgi:transposase